MLLFAFLQAVGISAQSRSELSKVEADSSVLRRINNYGACMEGAVDGIHTNVYLRYIFKTKRRNPTLAVIPTMYYVSKGKREHAGEAYEKVFIHGKNIKEAQTQLSLSTIPHNRGAMAVLLKYLMPNIYDVTIVDNQILSPLNTHNTKLYRYTVTYLTGNRAEIVFRPRRYNTQLVSGSAIADRSTGRIIKIKFNGEFDMIHFRVDATMGTSGIRSLIPKTCDINARFHFMGNRITTSYHSVYDNPVDLPDSIKNLHDMTLMEELRPTPIPTDMRELYDKHFTAKKDTIMTVDTTVVRQRHKRWDKILWDAVGDNLITRIKGKFGNSGQGSFRISPILNPISLSYSKRKGVTYKIRIRGNYIFSTHRDLSLYFRGGYSFKQHQFYFKVPLRYTFNRKRNGYVEAEVGNGNRITNSNIVEQVKHERLDSINWNKMNLEYFKDFYTKLTVNYDISSRWSIQPGVVFHRRSAVDKKGFILADRPVNYYSFAPSMQVQYRPNGWKGIILTADYERGIKGVGNADMQYERIEMDAAWRKQLHSLRQLSVKAGCGFYTTRNEKSYFLDYKNFREENIPGGWNDDWTGEFQLLNSNWYNASEYYARTNITYESPLMLLSHIPLVGRLMEMERIYVNTLYVERLHPYIESGYGFTNRFFSMGIFIASSNHAFEGFGCRFSFELFRDW